ncbi:MAG TPA: TRAM domain-containing protein, partial [Blastocatellia bacterium]|nr:TRAM domain-containing protein [Blastocatellia bacterium]
MSKDSIKTGDVIEVVTERLAYGGDAVARVGGLAVFIKGAAPRERVRARVIERKKNFARAVIDQIIEPSPERREPPCRYFGDCGGCQLQHLSYGAQLEAKAGFVRDALSRIGKIDWREEIKVHSASELGYRSRAQIKLEPPRSPERKGKLRIGFNRAGSHSVCDVESCPVLVPELNSALARIRTSVKQEANGGGYGGPLEIEMAAGDCGLAVSPLLAGFDSAEIKRQVGGHT